MNKIVVTFITLLFAVSGISQKIEIPKKANIIVVEINFNDLGRLLIENDFEIKSSNKDFGTIVTEPRVKTNWLGSKSITLKCVLNENLASIKAYIDTAEKVNNTSLNNFRLKYHRGWKKDFKEIVKIFKGYKVTFEIEEED